MYFNTILSIVTIDIEVMKQKNAKSPTSEALERLFAMTPDRYAFCIISFLGENRFVRFSRLQVLLDVNPTTLSARLRRLQRMGLISRKSFHSVPPRVEYSLTPIGRSLWKHVAALSRWACENCPPSLSRQPTKPRVK